MSDERRQWKEYEKNKSRLSDEDVQRILASQRQTPLTPQGRAFDEKLRAAGLAINMDGGAVQRQNVKQEERPHNLSRTVTTSNGFSGGTEVRG